MHWCLNGAFQDPLRWKWITVNPLDQAEPPTYSMPKPWDCYAPTDSTATLKQNWSAPR
ncbi:hypothetical protein Atai01_08100 [Amycolatopsis taiwanensis]|uniref:Uncharacterized protein n=1 Tax=Amycolatopsis taiwanensis TaxID=342230 RepID=A0A9W6VF60_9PSEU|nr:hypothetical protein Atai01_08100 [Amycolatopsis taiwanensis]